MTAQGRGAQHDTVVKPRILLFYDYVCPFCYVDQFRFERLSEEFGGLEIIGVPFELRPDMPDEGYRMSELEASGHSERVEEHLTRVADKEGVPLAIPAFLPKTHRAMVLAEIARDRGAEEHRLMHHELFAAYFARGLDIGSAEVLLEIARARGLDPDEVARAWAEGTYETRLHEFRHVALNLGLTATPAALICSELIIGSRPHRVLKDAVERCLAGPAGDGGGVVASRRGYGS
jgi:predicted DsbA family dithiol-disulfide isomerase